MSNQEKSNSGTPANLSDAVLASPGPRTWREVFVIAVKGLCMGLADIIPGVSGGTIAFISGIYEDLLAAIASFDLAAVKALFRLDFKAAAARVHLRFLVPLFVGIGFAVVATARLVHYMLENHPVPIWSLFFGLIAASVLVLRGEVSRWTPGKVAALVCGAVAAWFITGMIPVETPEAAWFVFFCGMVAICAMILPGISGSFILLILGKYFYITGAIKNPFSLASITIICVFGLGALVGITGFTRLLRWLLARFHETVMCVLAGFMLGAMRKVWPWKEVTASVLDSHGKLRVLTEAMRSPAAYAEATGQDPQILTAVLLMCAGFAVVLAIEAFSGRRKSGADK